jgi:hypothetical protein
VGAAVTVYASDRGKCVTCSRQHLYSREDASRSFILSLLPFFALRLVSRIDPRTDLRSRPSQPRCFILRITDYKDQRLRDGRGLTRLGRAERSMVDA